MREEGRERREREGEVRWGGEVRSEIVEKKRQLDRERGRGEKRRREGGEKKAWLQAKLTALHIAIYSIYYTTQGAIKSAEGRERESKEEERK